ncbi:MAG: hypothetical protein ABIK98_16460 [Pseudomonadota bacterium]
MIEAVQVGDIGPETDWSKALNGVDAVVHLAEKRQRGQSLNCE